MLNISRDSRRIWQAVQWFCDVSMRVSSSTGATQHHVVRSHALLRLTVAMGGKVAGKRLWLEAVEYWRMVNASMDSTVLDSLTQQFPIFYWLHMWPLDANRLSYFVAVSLLDMLICEKIKLDAPSFFGAASKTH